MRNTGIPQQTVMLFILLLLMSGPAFAASFSYDFNSLAGNDTQPFADLNGQDGWTSQGYSDCGGYTNPNGYIMGVTATFGFDTTKTLRFAEVGCGYGADASHKRTSSFKMPVITGATSKVVLQGDFLVGAWTNTLRYSYDADSNGIIRKSNTTEIGPGVDIGADGSVQLRVYSAKATPTTVALADLGISGLDWVRLRLEIDPSGTGSGSVFYRDLTRGDPGFQPVPGLQNVNMELDGASAATNPVFWDSVYIHLEGAGTGLDNLLLETKDKSVAYVYDGDTASRDSFSSLLADNGIPVVPVYLAEAETYNFGSDRMIIIGNDTGGGGTWNGTAAAINNIKSTGRPIVGIGGGGSSFFENVAGLFITYGQSMGESLNAVKVVDPAAAFWSSPYSISNGGADSLVNIFSGGGFVYEVSNPTPVAGVTRVGRSGNAANPNHYPVMFEVEAGRCYQYWGFTGSPVNMTASGKQLFVNFVENPCAAVSQYADIVTGFSSQYASAGPWAAVQVLGPSDTNSYGDNGTAWASGSKDGTQEYIMVEFASPVYSSGATIRETDGNGFVTQIDAVDSGNVLHTVWTGTDPSLPGSPEDFEVSWSPTNYLVKGLKVYVDTDHVSNGWEEIDSIRLHGVPAAEVNPPSGSMIITGGGYTASANVTLNFTCSDTEGSCAEMRFSNDNANWSTPEAYAITKSWTLNAGDGTKTVYVKFKDNSGNWSGVYSDTIILDTVLPNGFIRINNDTAYTASSAVLLAVSASDVNSLEMKFSNDGEVWSSYEPYATEKPWALSAGDGTKTVYAKFRDSAGNVSAISSASIKLDSGHSFQNASYVINYSSQYGSGGWSAAQTLGGPDTFSYGDYSSAWASANKDGTQEYLTLGFANPVYADGVVIRETYGNGFVTRIDALDTGNTYHTVWTGTDTSVPGSPADFDVSWTETAYLVKGVRIYIDTSHSGVWEEIDSVQLKGALSAGMSVLPSVSPGGGIVCDGTYNCTITPDNGYHIVDVLVDGISVGPAGSYQFADDGFPHIVEAVFAEGVFTLLANKMTEGRGGHTQTLMNDGRVLIAGGFNYNSGLYVPTASAEIYDPASKIFTKTGNMVTARGWHTATLLPDGKVLIAGGTACTALCNPYLSSMEVYDPATGTFSFANDMSSAREAHTATLLTNGLVFLAGGISGNNGSNLYLGDADLYDPATKSVTNLANVLGSNRSDHTATLLKNGTVFIAAGRNEGGWLDSAGIFDPSGNTFTIVASMNQPRAYHDAALMEDGRVLLMGGYYSGPISSAEVFDPTGNTFTYTSNDMQISRRSPAAVTLFNGKVLVTGGSDGNGYNGGRESADIYDPATNKFVNAGKMSFKRSAPATILPDGAVLLAGGFPESWGGAVYDTAEIYSGYDSFNVTVNSPANGSISCSAAKVLRGGSSECLIGSNSGYHLSSLADNGVPVLSKVSGNTYSLIDITADHYISAVFSHDPVNASCGTSNGLTFTTAPTADLCKTGISSSVGSGAGKWTWTCSGLYGGTDANCYAIAQAAFASDPSMKKYSLGVTKTGAGNGTVTSSLAGINCGGDCNEVYHSGKTITLTAKAEKDSAFKAWTGCDKTKGIYCTVAVTGDMTVVAGFDKVVPKISTGSNLVDFGSVKTGRLKNKSIKVTNTGSGLLVISAMAEGGNANMFGTRLAGKKTIKPGASYALKLFFKPKSGGPKTAILRITSSDPDTPELNITMQGEGIIKK